MKIYKRFNGSAVEYVNLHNRIKAKIGKPKQCHLCRNKDCGFELANLTQKYTEELNDWAYMCGSCHKRWDSPKYHWRDKAWYKFCVGCRAIKAVTDFYKRKSNQICKNGKIYKQTDTTEKCVECTKKWSKNQRLNKKNR